jgi:predicted XRE-type DNA-binding protein
MNQPRVSDLLRDRISPYGLGSLANMVAAAGC